MRGGKIASHQTVFTHILWFGEFLKTVQNRTRPSFHRSPSTGQTSAMSATRRQYRCTHVVHFLITPRHVIDRPRRKEEFEKQREAIFSRRNCRFGSNDDEEPSRSCFGHLTSRNCTSRSATGCGFCGTHSCTGPY